MAISTIAELVSNKEGRYKGNLETYFKIVFEKASNVYHPYHNMRHMLHVLWECYDALSKLPAAFGGSPEWSRAVLIAALFHDFNHSGQLTGNDDLEVERAVRGMKKHLLPEDQIILVDIEENMWSTQFPYVQKNEVLPLGAQILRDADMSQSFSSAWIQQIIFGLSVEMRVSPIEMLRMQESFMANVEFATDWGLKKFGPLREQRVNEVRELLKILT